MTTHSIIEAIDVSKGYSLGGERIDVLSGLTFSVERGEMIAVMGKSGVGKSTFLHVLGALDRPDAGELRIHGESVLGMSEPRLADFRNRSLGFVFQFHHLQTEFSALENVMMPQLIGRKSPRDAASRAEELLGQVGLAHRMQHKPSEMSGGEQQRVAVARALANEPSVILADEPTGNLDEPTSDGITRLLREINETTGVAFVVATHSSRLAAAMHRTFHLRQGRLFAEPAETVSSTAR